MHYNWYQSRSISGTMATENQNFTTLESYFPEFRESMKEFQSSMNEKFKQVMEKIDDLRVSNERTLNMISELKTTLPDHEDIEAATNENEGNGDEYDNNADSIVHEVGDSFVFNAEVHEKLTEKLEDSSLPIHQVCVQSVHDKVISVPKNKFSSLSLTNNTVIGAIDAYKEEFSVASKMFDERPKRDEYIPVLKPKPPDNYDTQVDTSMFGLSTICNEGVGFINDSGKAYKACQLNFEVYRSNMILYHGPTDYSGDNFLYLDYVNELELIHYNNQRGEGKVFSFDLFDSDGGKIRVTCFNVVADQFYHQIEEFFLESTSTVQLCSESSMPQPQFHFRSIIEIEGLERNSVINVIGVVYSISPSSLIMRKNGAETHKRVLQLKDMSGRNVEVILWGNYQRKIELLASIIDGKVKFDPQPIIRESWVALRHTEGYICVQVVGPLPLIAVMLAGEGYTGHELGANLSNIEYMLEFFSSAKGEVKELKELAAKLHGVDEFAVDLEHNQYQSFQGLTCPMQIFTRTDDFVVDTLKLRTHIGQYLREIFKDPTKKEVMYGADWDIIWLQRDFGLYICNLFHTGQTSRVLQLERNRLEFLLHHFCGVTANKEYQNEDWRLGPLIDEMLRYAREDTHYMLHIYDLMRIRLLYSSSESEYSETSLVEGANLSAQQLAIVAGLCKWRNVVAHAEDESTGYILPNKTLLEIAKQMSLTTSNLRRLVKSKHQYIDRNLATVVSIIRHSIQNAAAYDAIAGQLVNAGVNRNDVQDERDGYVPALPQESFATSKQSRVTNMTLLYPASGAEATIQVLKKPNRAFGALLGNSAAKRQFDPGRKENEEVKSEKILPKRSRTESLNYARRYLAPILLLLLPWMKSRSLWVASSGLKSLIHSFTLKLVAVTHWEKLAEELTLHYCSFLGQSDWSTLSVVVALGAEGLPTLLKWANVVATREQEWQVMRQLPVPMDLEVFVCFLVGYGAAKDADVDNKLLHTCFCQCCSIVAICCFQFLFYD